MQEIQSAVSLGRRSPFSARSVGREGDNCPSHTPSQLEALGAGHPPCRGGTGLPTACPKKLDPGQGRLGRAKLTVGGRAELAPCHSEDRPGSGPSMVSIAGGRTVPCCSGPKVAALTVGTVLLLTGIGAASWAIGESGQTPAFLPSPAPGSPQPACPHFCLLCSDCSTQE